ncbi:Putative Ubiquitin carboxyl-terminal hydrolase [Rhizopus microsporus]|nr:Putative Ubiquitin carboxyl-terminal hydrolase [Rhizopus microsporus]
MTEAEVSPPPALSIIEDFETIAKKEMPLIEEEIVSFKCVHWDVLEWSKLDHRVLGPVFEAGGHDWNVLMFPSKSIERHQVFTRTMVGDWMWKYTRHRLRKENKHQRFFWFHPYTQMLYWSTNEPGNQQNEAIKNGKVVCMCFLFCLYDYYSSSCVI